MKLIQPNFKILKQEPDLEGIYKMIELAARVCYKSENKITENSAKKFVDMLIARHHLAMLEQGTVYLAIPYKIMSFYTQGGEEKYIVTTKVQKYIENKYSTVVLHDDGWSQLGFISTNYRVLYENNWLDDLEYLCEPTEYHEKRISVKFVTSIGIGRELTRHRVFSFAQESTRYCNYSKNSFSNEITFVIPSWSTLKQENTVTKIEDGKRYSGLVGTNSKEDNALGIALLKAEHRYMQMIEDGFKPEQARDVLPLATKSELVMTGFISDWQKVFAQRVDGITGNPHPDMKALMEPIKEEFIKKGYING